jgi:hypothetical protein
MQQCTFYLQNVADKNKIIGKLKLKSGFMNGANSRGRNGNGSGGQQQQVNVRVDVTINNDIDLGYQVVRVVLRNLLQSTDALQ